MAIPSKRMLVYAKKETGGYGVDAAPNPATDDALLARDVTLSKPKAFLDRESQIGYYSRMQGLIGNRSGEISFRTETIGAAGAEPDITALLQACNMAHSASGVYAPTSAIGDSCTIYVYIEGLLQKFLGCKGNMRIVATVGDILYFEWTFRSLYAVISSQEFPSSWTFPTTLPLKCEKITLTVSGAVEPTETLELDLQNEINESVDLTAGYGIKRIYVTGRNPVGSYNPEITAASAVITESQIDTPTTVELAANFARGTNGLRISASKCVIKDTEFAKRNGLNVFGIPFQLALTSGNDELGLNFSV